MANRMVRWFNLGHLKPEFRRLGEGFEALVRVIDEGLPESAEKTAGLRHLLEAKDCIVRATIEAEEAAHARIAEQDAAAKGAGAAVPGLVLALLLGFASVAGAACEARVGKACNVQVPCCATAADGTPLACSKTTGSATCQPTTATPTTTSSVPSTARTTTTTTSTTSTTRCADKGELCGARGTGEQQGKPPCCTHYRCPKPGEPDFNRDHVACEVDPADPPPATTTTSSSTTTSSTRPTSGTTSTTLPPAAMYDPTYGDVGRHWTSQSQEMMSNHQTGLPMNQADAWGLLLYLRFVFEPEMIAAADTVPSCSAAVPKMLAAMATTTDKFLADYVLRPLMSGGTYAVHGNYHWDLTHNEYLRRFQGCLLADAVGNAGWLLKNPQWGPALDVRVQNGAIVRGDPLYRVPTLCAGEMASDGSYSCARADVPALFGDLNAGAVSAKFKDPPLTPVQCAALADFRRAHDAGAGVPAAGAAFLATATTPRQQTLFHMPFTTQRNPKRSAEARAPLEARKHAGFAEWQAGFHCKDGKPPSLPEIVVGLLRHCGAHNLLALPPGARLRSICPATVGPHRDAVVNCPWVDS